MGFLSIIPMFREKIIRKIYEMHDWSAKYLNYAENKAQLQEFLKEKNATKLLEKATGILENNSDTIFFGFVASEAVYYDNLR